MKDLVENKNSNEIEGRDNNIDLVELSEDLLNQAKSSIENGKSLTLPIGEIATLGAGVASLLPALNTVTQTVSISGSGLYSVANMAAGDALKVAANGNFWGAMHTADGASKMAQLQAAGPLTATTSSVMAINPATMMMAVALFSIEKKLDKIEDTQKEILSFLETEKESEIEADVETLLDVVRKYKTNWDNEHYIASNHKLVLDIQRTARKNTNSYQKKIDELLKANQFIVLQNAVDSTLDDSVKKFQYYRLSLFTFTFASLLEILLSGNFHEDYIRGIQEEVRKMERSYRNLYSECCYKLEEMGNASLESNVMDGIGAASKAVGGFLGNIPFINEGPVDEFLQEQGENLQNNAGELKEKALKMFAPVENPDVEHFVETMENVALIYNNTAQICFDKENVYLLQES